MRQDAQLRRRNFLHGTVAISVGLSGCLHGELFSSREIHINLWNRTQSEKKVQIKIIGQNLFGDYVKFNEIISIGGSQSITVTTVNRTGYTIAAEHNGEERKMELKPNTAFITLVITEDGHLEIDGRVHN